MGFCGGVACVIQHGGASVTHLHSPASPNTVPPIGQPLELQFNLVNERVGPRTMTARPTALGCRRNSKANQIVCFKYHTISSSAIRYRTNIEVQVFLSCRKKIKNSNPD